MAEVSSKIDNSSKSIGARVKLARIEAGLTQTELGEKIGVTSVMISRYEGGKTSPLHKLSDIASALNKTTEYFFGGEDKGILYDDVKRLVRLLKDRAKDDIWPFKPQVPLLDYQDIENLDYLKTSELGDLDSREKIDCAQRILDKDKDSFAIKVGHNFEKSAFPKGSVLIIASSIKAGKRSFVLRTGKRGLIAGRKASTRGKLIGTVVQSFTPELFESS